jgi:hypothetical protein
MNMDHSSLEPGQTSHILPFCNGAGALTFEQGQPA